MRHSPRAWCAALVAATLAALPCLVAAQVLYKWTDTEGRVQYSDQPPKNFAGPVTKIEPDEKPTASAPPAASAEGKSAVANGGTRDMIEMAAKKRAERDKLEANLNAARDRLVAAKAALDNASPSVNEQQAIQQRLDVAAPVPGPGSGTTGGMLGMSGLDGTTARSNCNTARNSNGTPVTTCRTLVPSDAYYDRVKTLQDAVKSAEDDVAAAEQAYRRGVD